MFKEARDLRKNARLLINYMQPINIIANKENMKEEQVMMNFIKQFQQQCNFKPQQIDVVTKTIIVEMKKEKNSLIK